MSTALYEETKKDINEAFQSKSTSKIEKETSFILNQLIVTIMSGFRDRVKGVSIERVDFNLSYVLSDKHKDTLISWLNNFQKLESTISDLEFGKIKIDLENWYHDIGGKEIHFEYQEDYLLTPSQASEKLKVSTVTLNKYIKQGFESVNTTSHRKIPKHAIELWKDPVYAIKMQMLAQKKKIQKQTPEERINEINQELIELQKKYKAKSISKAFSGLDLESMDDPSDYFEWRDLEEEKEELLTMLIEDSGHE